MDAIVEAILDQLLNPVLLSLAIVGLALLFIYGWKHFSSEIAKIKEDFDTKIDKKADCEPVKRLEDCIFGSGGNPGIGREVTKATTLSSEATEWLRFFQQTTARSSTTILETDRDITIQGTATYNKISGGSEDLSNNMPRTTNERIDYSQL